MKKVAMTLSIFFLIGLASACFNPADSFAFEVLLNKPGISYDLSKFERARNVIVNEEIIYRSHYSDKLAVIIREVNNPVRGLSVRIQIPTERVEVNFTEILLTIESNVTPKFEEASSLLSSLGYKVLKKSKEVELLEAEKDDGKIRISIFGGEKSQLSVTIRGELNEKLKKELKSIAFAAGFGGEWENARIERKEIFYEDLKPVESVDNFDFKEAVRVELEWLKENGIISGLSKKDIEEISKVAKAGLSGHNSRIVWEDGWKPYYKTRNPVLLKGMSCESFPLQKLPKGEVTFESKEIPGFDVFLLLILFLLALNFKR